MYYDTKYILSINLYSNNKYITWFDIYSSGFVNTFLINSSIFFGCRTVYIALYLLSHHIYFREFIPNLRNKKKRRGGTVVDNILNNI